MVPADAPSARRVVVGVVAGGAGPPLLGQSSCDTVPAVTATRTEVIAEAREETISHCPACFATEVSRVVDVREFMFGTQEEFPYAECGRCGTVRLVDVPPDLALYYPKAYYSVADDPQHVLGRPPTRQVVATLGRSAVTGRQVISGVARQVIRRRQAQTLLSIYAAIARCGVRSRSWRILDVGAGSGLLVYALSLAGFSAVHGVDPFAPGDRTFDTGARLEAVGLADCAAGGWDLIMFNHSFEHLLDPEAELRLAASRLGADGRILVRMPTVSSWAWEHFGRDWVQLDAPRHTVIFSRGGMAALVERCGLQVLDVTDDSTAFQYWGSGQVRRGVALDDPTSHMVDERRSPFSRGQIRQWARAAERLNRQGRGDQAAWVLRPAPERQ